MPVCSVFVLLTVVQVADILLFSKATYKCTVADIESELVSAPRYASLCLSFVRTEICLASKFYALLFAFN